MDRRPRATRRPIAFLALAGASVVLHAFVVAGLDGRWPRAPRAPEPAPVSVALLAPTPSATPAAPPAAAPPPASRPAPRPAVRPRPRPAAPSAPVGLPAPAASAPTVAASASDFDAGGAHAVAAASPDGPAPDPGSPVAGAPGPTEPPAPVASVAPDAAAAAGSAAAPPEPPASPPPAATPPSPPLPPLPASQRQRFRVYWGDFSEQRSVARLEYRLERDGDRYVLRTEGEAEGLISLVYAGTLSQVSVGRLGPGGLEPLRYTEQRGKRPERSVEFDPDAHRLVPTGGRGDPVALPPGTQDRLSVFYQIGLLARADPGRFVAGATRELPVASMRDVRVERFEVVGDETLMAPGGPIRALHLHRPPPPGTDDPRIDLWLGYDLEMLPVRLRVEDAGRRVLDQVIERGG